MNDIFLKNINDLYSSDEYKNTLFYIDDFNNIYVDNICISNSFTNAKKMWLLFKFFSEHNKNLTQVIECGIGNANIATFLQANDISYHVIEKNEFLANHYKPYINNISIGDYYKEADKYVNNDKKFIIYNNCNLFYSYDELNKLINMFKLKKGKHKFIITIVYNNCLEKIKENFIVKYIVQKENSCIILIKI